MNRICLVLSTGIAIVLLASPVGSRETMSGQQLLELCTSGESGSACEGYFREVLAELGSVTPPLPICRAKGGSIGALVALYISESKIYPDVLQVPAKQLITGMMLKFFACRAA